MIIPYILRVGRDSQIIGSLHTSEYWTELHVAAQIYVNDLQATIGDSFVITTPEYDITLKIKKFPMKSGKPVKRSWARSMGLRKPE